MIIIVGGQRQIHYCWHKNEPSAFFPSSLFSVSLPHPLPLPPPSLSLILSFALSLIYLSSFPPFLLLLRAWQSNVLLPDCLRICNYLTNALNFQVHISLETTSHDTLQIDWEISPVIEILADVVMLPQISRHSVNDFFLEPKKWLAEYTYIWFDKMILFYGHTISAFIYRTFTLKSSSLNYYK